MPEVQQSPDLHQVPLPTTIGCSKIGDPNTPGSRVTGAPSQKYPILRDLEASPARVTLEVDTESKRVTGILKHIADGRGVVDPPRLVLEETPRVTTSVYLTKIIAFRVLKVEAELGEKGLVL